jgi:hypothetical protein
MISFFVSIFAGAPIAFRDHIVASGGAPPGWEPLRGHVRSIG